MRRSPNYDPTEAHFAIFIAIIAFVIAVMAYYNIH